MAFLSFVSRRPSHEDVDGDGEEERKPEAGNNEARMGIVPSAAVAVRGL